MMSCISIASYAENDQAADGASSGDLYDSSLKFVGVREDLGNFFQWKPELEAKYAAVYSKLRLSLINEDIEGLSQVLRYPIEICQDGNVILVQDQEVLKNYSFADIFGENYRYLKNYAATYASGAIQYDYAKMPGLQVYGISLDANDPILDSAIVPELFYTEKGVLISEPDRKKCVPSFNFCGDPENTEEKSDTPNADELNAKIKYLSTRGSPKSDHEAERTYEYWDDALIHEVKMNPLVNHEDSFEIIYNGKKQTVTRKSYSYNSMPIYTTGDGDEIMILIPSMAGQQCNAVSCSRYPYMYMYVKKKDHDECEEVILADNIEDFCPGQVQFNREIKLFTHGVHAHIENKAQYSNKDGSAKMSVPLSDFSKITINGTEYSYRMIDDPIYNTVERIDLGNNRSAMLLWEGDLDRSLNQSPDSQTSMDAAMPEGISIPAKTPVLIYRNEKGDCSRINLSKVSGDAK